MLKTITFLAGLGIIILLVAIIILVTVNWSDKFYAQLVALAVAFVGTVAALIVVLAMLKGDTVSDWADGYSC